MQGQAQHLSYGVQHRDFMRAEMPTRSCTCLGYQQHTTPVLLRAVLVLYSLQALGSALGHAQLLKEQLDRSHLLSSESTRDRVGAAPPPPPPAPPAAAFLHALMQRLAVLCRCCGSSPAAWLDRIQLWLTTTDNKQASDDTQQ